MIVSSGLEVTESSCHSGEDPRGFGQIEDYLEQMVNNPGLEARVLVRADNERIDCCLLMGEGTGFLVDVQCSKEGLSN